MAEQYNPVVRLSSMELERNAGPGRFGSLDGFVGEALKLTRLGCAYTEVAPGMTACPYHVHHAEDEMFVILSGEGEYRFGGQTYQVQAGDVLGAPVGGPEYAHQLLNTGADTLKYLAISSKADLEVCEYPDSGKLAIYSRPVHGTARRNYTHVGRQESRVGYYEGENTEGAAPERAEASN